LSENNKPTESRHVTELIDELRAGRINRRTFLLKAVILGVAVESASALATDAFAADVPRAGLPPKAGKTTASALPPTAVEGVPLAGVEIRIPKGIPISKADLARITNEFNNKIVATLGRHRDDGGTGARSIAKEIEQVKVQYVDSQGNPQ
jgi:hypothetical protein